MRYGRACLSFTFALMAACFAYAALSPDIVVENFPGYELAGVCCLIAIVLAFTISDPKPQQIVIQPAPVTAVTSTSEVKYLVVCPFCGAHNEQGVTLCSNCKAKI